VTSFGTTYIGIDPGAQGGMAALLDGGAVCFTSMPKDEAGIWRWVRSFEPDGDRDVRAVIEQVQGYIGEGQPGSSMFKFGQGYGTLRMALVAAGIPFEAVTPRVWQSALSIPPRKKSENRGQWKQRLKTEAEIRYPRLLVTLAVADALLLAEYCKMMHSDSSNPTMEDR